MGQLVHTITVSQSERRPCIVRGKKALFHKWEDKCEYIVKINAWLADEELSELKKAIEESGYLPPQVEVFPHRETVAIVELEDGAVLEVAVSEVRFVDSISTVPRSVYNGRPQERKDTFCGRDHRIYGVS